MLSYPIDEAETLLTSKLTAAKTSLSNCEEDLDFLREQITVRQTSTPRPLRRGEMLTQVPDYGGCPCKGLQLGGRTEEEREAGGGSREEEPERHFCVIETWEKLLVWLAMKSSTPTCDDLIYCEEYLSVYSFIGGQLSMHSS